MVRMSRITKQEKSGKPISEEDEKFRQQREERKLDRAAGAMDRSTQNILGGTDDPFFKGLARRKNTANANSEYDSVFGMDQQRENARHRRALESGGVEVSSREKDIKRQESDYAGVKPAASSQRTASGAVITELEAKFNQDINVNTSFNIDPGTLAKRAAVQIQEAMENNRKAFEEGLAAELDAKIEELNRQMTNDRVNRNTVNAR